jgi:DnaJ-class molecular chaperone
MIADIECPRCRGQKWLLVRRAANGLHGVFEEDCPKCQGHGAIAADVEDEIEDWMRDE